MFKQIFECIRIFEYFPPNFDIRIRFVVILNAEYYSNILSKYFLILVLIFILNPTIFIVSNTRDKMTFQWVGPNAIEDGEETGSMALSPALR